MAEASPEEFIKHRDRILKMVKEKEQQKFWVG